MKIMLGTTWKISAITFLIGMFLGSSLSFVLTKDHYQKVIADKQLREDAANEFQQQAADSRVRLFSTTNDLLVGQASKKYQEDLKNVTDQLAIDRTHVSTGDLRLRDKAAVCRREPTTAASVVSASGSDDTGGAELSHEFTEYLLSEAARADALTVKVTGLQGVVNADRAAVDQYNASLPTGEK